ncbi:MAG: hypothetical protein COA67_07390 [Lutibacter sp.]|nr:MAG: hypothetical protein COA67_07390 [Lutibacter sp.]
MIIKLLGKHSAERIFDTLVDTQKIFVSMRTKFIPRKYQNTQKKSPIYLHVTGRGERKRVHTDVWIDTKKWDCANQCILKPNKEEEDLNLILDNYRSKITNIKTVYRLSEKILTPDLLIKELIE